MNEVFEITCGVCNKIIRSSKTKPICLFQFSEHLKRNHNLTKEKYLENYTIPQEFIVDKYRARRTSGEFNVTCNICNRIFYSDTKRKCCSNLFAHLRKNHNMGVPEYLKDNHISESFLKEFNEHPCRISKEKYRDPNFTKVQNEKTLNQIGEDEFKKLPTCEICGLKSKQLYSHIAKIHGIKVEDYRKKYKGNLEEENYLKYLSETRLGENNPMWGCGQSENSPFSPQFYIKKGYDEKSAEKLANDLCIKVKKEMTPEKQSVKIEYYKKKYNIGDIEAYDMLYKRQQTNAVENIAERHGISIIKAQNIRDDITKKWLNTMNSKSIEELAEINRKKIPNSISNVSIKFFDWLIKELGMDINNIQYDKNEFWLTYENDNGNKSFYFYDFKYKNKIIEYNGTVYHADPRKYKYSDKPLSFLKSICKDYTANDIWKNDELKINYAIKKGYDILTIWERDVKENKYRILQKCKEFLLS